MQQRGFTLIELIIVIVILGILAVTAAPKFIDVQSDAQSATLQGVKAALTSGSQLVFAKAALAGKQKLANGATSDATDTQVTVNGQTIEINYGYPDAESMTAAMLGGFVDLSVTGADRDWTLSVGTANNDGSATSFEITPGAATPDFTSAATNACHVRYADAGQNTPPVITVVDTGC